MAMYAAAVRGNIKIISLLLKPMEFSAEQIVKIKESVLFFIKLRNFEDKNAITKNIRDAWNPNIDYNNMEHFNQKNCDKY